VQETHTLAVLVGTTCRVLARRHRPVLRARGTTSKSLTVAEVIKDGHRSRITVVTIRHTASDRARSRSRLTGMVPIYEVPRIDRSTPSGRARNWRCSKSSCGSENRASPALCEHFPPNVVDSTLTSFVFEIPARIPKSRSLRRILMARFGLPRSRAPASGPVAEGLNCDTCRVVCSWPIAAARAGLGCSKTATGERAQMTTDLPPSAALLSTAKTGCPNAHSQPASPKQRRRENEACCRTHGGLAVDMGTCRGRRRQADPVSGRPLLLVREPPLAKYRRVPKICRHGMILGKGARKIEGALRVHIIGATSLRGARLVCNPPMWASGSRTATRNVDKTCCLIEIPQPYLARYCLHQPVRYAPSVPRSMPI